MKTVKIALFLAALTLIAFFLRVYKVSENPVSLNVDEVSIGYNAYSILKTGRDEYGSFMPLTFKSLGDYKAPAYIYLTVPSIALFGLNEFAVRFPSALFGSLAVPLIFLLIFEMTKNKYYALAGAVLLGFSPWSIYFSRLGSEALVATTFVIAGIWALLKFQENRWYWGVTASFFLILSMYTYHSERLFVPIFISAFLLMDLKKVWISRKKWIFFLLLCSIFILPLAISLFFGDAGTRVGMTVITSDAALNRGVLVTPLTTFSGWSFFDQNNFLLFFHWIRKYLAYLAPSFLFFNGLAETQEGTYGIGLMYLFEVPFLLLGVVSLCRKKVASRRIILLWVLAGIIPASLTLSEQHPIRTLVVLPAIVSLSGIGSVELARYISQFNKNIKYTVLGLFILFIGWNLVLAFLIYSVHFPKEKGEGFMEGTREAVNFALSVKDNYQEIVFDPVRGVEGPYIVSAPHAYILFYSHYDPANYQKLMKRSGDNSYGFDKFTVRPINWRSDSNLKDTLFIGSPWSLSPEVVGNGKILKKIYLASGKLALVIVSSK